MQATIYGRGQMVIPARARKEAGIHQGDVILVEPEGDGRILLVRLEKPARSERRVKIRPRKSTHAVGTAGRTVTSDQIRLFLSELPRDLLDQCLDASISHPAVEVIK